MSKVNLILSNYVRVITKLFVGLAILSSCSSTKKVYSTKVDSNKGLKDYYKPYFPIGVAVSPNALNSDESGLIKLNFNSLTPENDMKMETIHPKELVYNWKPADAIVTYAQLNNMKVRGHTLIWHNQTPDWIFKDSKTGKQVTKEVLLQRMKEHITQVISHFKGKVYAWDVVNEAISDNPKEFYRKSKYLEICGEEFIFKAFQWAHEADPNAVLFYNDYNEISVTKRAKIITLINKLIAAGIPINAVGLQSHWAVNEPTMDQLNTTLSDFSKLGLKIQITELDISVYPKEHQARERRTEDLDTSFSAAKEEKQMEQYKMCFDLFRKYKDFITGVTFWNVSDRNSWLDNFPVQNRKDYPLLFDKNLTPKKAYWQVTKF